MPSVVFLLGESCSWHVQPPDGEVQHRGEAHPRQVWRQQATGQIRPPPEHDHRRQDRRPQQERGDTAPVPWVLYDCASNAWISVDVSGPNPTNVSMGLMYDPQRELVVAVDTNSVVYVLRLDVTESKPAE
jgi:hypothetical protein